MHEKPTGAEEWVLLCKLPNEIEARLTKSLLESFGIATHIAVEPVASLYGLTTGDLAVARVLVPRRHLEEAKRILEAEPTGDEMHGEPPEIDD